MAKIGIDFGTANSAASYLLPDGTIHVCQSRHGPFLGANTTPSFVRFNADGSVAKYGAAAFEELVDAPGYVVWGVKRLLGKPYQQALQQGELKRFAYPIEEADDGSIDIRIGVMRFKPLDVVRILLQCITKDCEAAFNPIGGAVDEAVITRPAYFEPEAVTELKRAALDPPPGSPKGTPGCFRSVELLTEPEAAANAYSRILWSPDDPEHEKWVMTIDWGAGTLDIVISRMCRDDTGVARVTSVFPAYGDPSFGGFDMDDALVREVHATLGIAGLTPTAEADLRRMVERAKIALSTKPTTECWVAVAGRSLRLSMARDDESIPASERAQTWIVLNEVLDGILNRFRAHMRQAREKAGLRGSDIGGIILVGGPMYMPCVREAIAGEFWDNPRVLQFLRTIRTPDDFPVSPMEAVVRGSLMREPGGPPVSRVASRSYGYLLAGDVGDILVEEGFPLPVSRQAEHIGIRRITAGGSVAVSLLQVEKHTVDGTKCYRKGRYPFTPLVRDGERARIGVELDVSVDEELVLKVADETESQLPVMTLRLAQHEVHKIPGFTRIRPEPEEPEDPVPPPPPRPIPLVRVREVTRQVDSLLTAVGRNAAGQDPEVAGRCLTLKSLLDRVPDEPLSLDVQKLHFSELCIAAVQLVNVLKCTGCFGASDIEKWLQAFEGVAGHRPERA